jgi:O-antigen/teichoic acid export membrane protein
LSRLTKNTFVRGGVLVLGSTLAWHLSNFAFNSVSARILGPSSYGTLAAVVAMLYVASPLFVSVQTVASRITTKLASRGEWSRLSGLARYYALRLAVVGLALAAVVALSSSAIATFLRVPSPTPIAFAAVALVFASVTHLQRGLLQGSMRFERYALATLAETGAKIATALVLLLWVWHSVDAAVLAIVLGSLFGLIANIFLLRFLPPAHGQFEPIPHPVRYSLLTLSCLLFMALLLSVDVLAAKRYLDPHSAGLYAAVSLSGKIVFFGASALVLYLFPIFSDRREQGLDARGALGGALCLLSAGSVAVLAIYFLVPQIVVGPLFGPGYQDAATYIGPAGAAFIACAVVYLTSMYLLSQENWTASPVLAATVVADVCGLYTFHASITQLIAVQGVVFATSALLLTTLCSQSHLVPSGAPDPT